MTQHKEKERLQVIQSVVQAVNMTVKIKQDDSGMNMSYNFIGDYVGFDAKRLVEARNELMLPTSLEVYVKTMTLHELGHAVDREALQASLPCTMEIFTMKKQHALKEIYRQEHLLAMLIEEHEMNRQFEQTAWTNAWMLNHTHHLVPEKDFHYIKQHSLATYQKLYDQDLQAYHHLLNQQMVPLV
ncbi:integrase [Lysinibacillus fusiformis]|uniref:integrase n=1 Tax=Lysinibacillus fusiformis TaxID=28031 RepID=UPI0019678BDD|nr:integrase [Lysinibacillus fusiformis]QSB09174.1 integrase [Lysinibacillus fusiformis]